VAPTAASVEEDDGDDDGGEDEESHGSSFPVTTVRETPVTTL
jgi:hypothetical protein